MKNTIKNLTDVVMRMDDKRNDFPIKCNLELDSKQVVAFAELLSEINQSDSEVLNIRGTRVAQVLESMTVSRA